MRDHENGEEVVGNIVGPVARAWAGKTFLRIKVEIQVQKQKYFSAIIVLFSNWQPDCLDIPEEKGKLKLILNWAKLFDNQILVNHLQTHSLRSQISNMSMGILQKDFFGFCSASDAAPGVVGEKQKCCNAS